MFTAETGIVIGKSKFAELQPKHVKLSNKLPHNVCLCIYHENFILAVTALYKGVPSFPKYSVTLCEAFMCSPVTKTCGLGNSKICNNLFLNKMQEEVESEDFYENEVSWHMWEKVNGSLTEVVCEDSVTELIIYLHEMLSRFFIFYTCLCQTRTGCKLQ